MDWYTAGILTPFALVAIGVAVYARLRAPDMMIIWTVFLIAYALTLTIRDVHCEWELDGLLPIECAVVTE
jgi:hypothetical protein